MKKIIFLTLTTVLILACGLPGTGPAPADETPTVTSTYTNTPVPTKPTPTFTPTPTLIAAATSPPTPTLSLTELAAFQVTPTPLEFKTRTPTPSTLPSGFTTVLVSETQLYYGNCEPSTVTIRAQVIDSQRVTQVTIFTRLLNISNGNMTDWDKGVIMEEIGNGVFKVDLNANWLHKKQEYYPDAWVVYQLVATDKYSRELGRSQVYSDKLKISPCAAQ
jgi:hypothetical protein